MMANGGEGAFRNVPMPGLARRTGGDRLAIGMLTLALLSSFLQYCVERNDLVRLVPVGLLIAAAFLLLLVSAPQTRQARLASATLPATMALIVVVSVPALMSSLYRPNSFPLQYGAAMIAILFAARILLSGVGLEGVLLCFFWATTAGMLIVVGMTFADLLGAMGATRYAPFFLDPNRIGFFAATAIPAQLWFATRGRLMNKFALVASLVCVFVIVAASSRGSTGALLIGVAITAVIYGLRLLRFPPFAISRNKLLVAMALLCGLAALAAEQPAFENAGSYLWTKLELDSRARGMNSGLTGRTTNWAAVSDILPKTSWLTGNGYRTSDEDFNFAVDNGYLAGIYEVGVFSTIVVVAKYLWAAVVLSLAYVTARSAGDTCALALVFTLVIFLANGFVHRVLFGSGDPASLLTLFVLVANRRDVFRLANQPS